MTIAEAIKKCEYGLRFSDEEYSELQVMLENLKDLQDKSAIAIKINCFNTKNDADEVVEQLEEDCKALERTSNGNSDIILISHIKKAIEILKGGENCE